ncbi:MULTISPECIES: hypothetical protein [unclassified Mycolicibacterium]|uniref:hypothetical protein n=1 Tax=unclassified Mycolicibacterium TaxID=2636767 RepID=UPI0012DE272E|nr:MULTISPECIES: hypothetical protein [unclassified Mycolicibacterium]MUL50146.1 hypothetical protein [Mycolicibacterium sp. CBMA 360]MUL62797.1 hypothetical protein [Mycolicibacterium sp. CBMA 335]MUL69668.1 hypothetical protein [Mycolicibacterium sp. CBMA 311]MUL97447.1 hypothetical protein [Mycolicibacterium sp. CBMA 230]MUM33107.1 hypothetical protein [Mycolicibacterium sp. CBMA 361]
MAFASYSVLAADNGATDIELADLLDLDRNMIRKRRNRFVGHCLDGSQAMVGPATILSGTEARELQPSRFEL